MEEFSVLQAWLNEPMRVYFTQGNVVEGRLMGADQAGLEFQLTRVVRHDGEGLEPGEEYEGDPTFIFVPWNQIGMLIRS